MCPNTPMGVKVDEFGCPLDTDKDGVADYLDRCPDTPTGVQVNAEGCPIDSDGDGVADYLDKCPNTPKNVKVDKNGCPLDTDGDGVADYLDKCPNTPKDVKVDKDGCPLDSDGDGVPDYLDKCPDTPKGTKVDNYGCPEVTEPFKVIVYFGFDKSNLTKEATAKLDGAADFLKNNPDAMFSLEGHTCWIGTEVYNMKLSERRAKSVFDYLVKKGIDKQRMQQKWFGETMPAEDNKTKKGRELNRRTVVIQMLER
ncbi:MAG: OmpA family protein [Ignavibacteria bacterium]|nr:OmpA family protein [Ignavibacteria bacterium]